MPRNAVLLRQNALSGNQTIDASAVSGTAGGFNVWDAVKSKSIPLAGLGKDYDESAITISGWKAEEGTIKATEYADNHFVFTDGEGYYTSGKVSCTLTNGDASVTLTGIEITPAEAPTANEGVSATEVKVVAYDGAINIKNAAGKNVVISTILGQIVANEVLTSGNATISVPAGIAIVSVDGEEAVKVSVR